MKKNSSKYLAIILAAGKGSRLSKTTPKPLYKINNIPIIDYLFNSIFQIPNVDILTVVGYKKDKVIKYIEGKSSYVIQDNQDGTGDAIFQCVDYIKDYKNVLIFVGDTPFINHNNISLMISSHKASKSDCTFLYSEFPFDLPYAKLVFNSQKKLIKLVEFAHLLEHQKKNNSLFTSQYLFNSELFLDNIFGISKDAKTDEYNLTDIINIYLDKNLNVNPILVKEFWTLMGVNTIDDIKVIESYTSN